MKNNFLLLKLVVMVSVFNHESSYSSLPENPLYKAIEIPQNIFLINDWCQKNSSMILERSPNNAETSLDLVLKELCLYGDPANAFEKDKFFYFVGSLLLHHVTNNNQTFIDIKNSLINCEMYDTGYDLTTFYCERFCNTLHRVEKALSPNDVKEIKELDFKKYRPQQYQRKNQSFRHKKTRR